MKKNDLMKSILDSSIQEGILKEEKDYFNSLDFKDKDTESIQEHFSEYVELNAMNRSIKNFETTTINLAAETIESKTHLKPKFYISGDDKFAIKIVIKNGENHCSIITNENVQFEEILIYCEELDDYYVTSNDGHFILSNISGLDLKSINFKILLSNLSFNLYKIDDNFHFISELELGKVVLSEDDVYVIIELSPNISFKKFVLKNENLKIIISQIDNRIKINKKLLCDKNSLLVY